MSSRFPRFSVVIPSFNGRSFLETCLKSLEEVRYPRDEVEWIVVDNGSTDGTAAWVGRYFPRTQVIALPRNAGFTGGIAAGVRAARGEHLVFLNNDMRVVAGWLDAFDEALRGQGHACAVGKILSWDGRNVDFVEGLLLFDGHALQRYQGARAERFEGMRPRPTFVACGGNMAVRRDVYLQVGGFDEAFFAYTEDVDFSWRLHAAGHAVVMAPGAVTFHHHQGTSSRLGVYRRGFLYERNAFANLLKNIDEPYFDAMMHAAWLTFIHRTCWITSLNAPESRMLFEDPFRRDEPGRPDAAMAGGGAGAAGSKRLLQRLADSLRRDGLRLTLGRILARAGRWLAPDGVLEAPASEERLCLDHPYVLSQLRALWHISSGAGEWFAKRRRVQALRKVSDRNIFRDFPPWVVSTYPGDAELFASEWFRELLPKDIAFPFASLEDVHGDP